jgi:hypothetical protein
MSMDIARFHFNTALLEALDWDEDQLKELTSHVSEYLEKASDKNLVVLLNNVELTWGSEVKKILIEIFNLEAFALNINNSENKYAN